MRTLERLTVRNFKSIRSQELRLKRLNIFIGGNGSGKSNLLEIFHFLSRVAKGELRIYTGVSGGADSLLHFGRKRSGWLSVELEFDKGTDANGYGFRLVPTEEDRFVFGEEKIWYHNIANYPDPMRPIPLGDGHAESKLTASKHPIAGHVRSDLDSYRIYHFHDTSAGAKVRQTGDLEDNRWLQTDAGNLAAFLYRLKQKHQHCFRNIEDTVRQIAPFFEGFYLEPSRLNPDKIQLEWKERGSEKYFNAHALSDGTLRFICLATLLLQPWQPDLILIDEPELGLHPAAVELLAALLESASERTQLVVATHSVTLVNQLTPEVVWVVERQDGASTFKNLEKADLSRWLDGYALGDLWEKNVIGGRP